MRSAFAPRILIISKIHKEYLVNCLGGREILESFNQMVRRVRGIFETLRAAEIMSAAFGDEIAKDSRILDPLFADR
jgi:hypothetical protein